MKTTRILAYSALLSMMAASQAVMAYDFNTKTKEATSFTKQANEKVYQELNFDDKTAFADADRGFIAPLLNDGNIDGVFNATAMNYMQDKKSPDSVNPSLWRHAQLVNRGGLYQVSEHIYQVRGQDLSNLTIIETDNGVVFYDVEYSGKALNASIALYEKHRGKRALKGVIMSHSHADHFGGFEGIYAAGLATPEDVQSGKLPVIAPVGFVEEAVSENVMGGNIMARRAGYQYGNVLKVNDKGIVTGALGPHWPMMSHLCPYPITLLKRMVKSSKLTVWILNFT